MLPLFFVSRRDATFMAPSKFLAVLSLTITLLTIILVYWWYKAWVLRATALLYLDGEGCADDERRLPFSDDNAAPTFLGLFQVPLFSGETLGLSCKENETFVDILYGSLAVAGTLVYLLNVVVLVRQTSGVRDKIQRLYRGDKSFLALGRAAADINESAALLHSVKYGAGRQRTVWQPSSLSR